MQNVSGNNNGLGFLSWFTEFRESHLGKTQFLSMWQNVQIDHEGQSNSYPDASHEGNGKDETQFSGDWK